jgi:hypothetical protein
MESGFGALFVEHFLWREASAQFGGSPFAVKQMIA